MTDHEQARRAARHSLRNVVSIRDFLLAVQVGSETAVAMLDKIESKSFEVLEVISGADADDGREGIRGRASVTTAPPALPRSNPRRPARGGAFRR
jgi:hypothetical protein